MREEDGQVRAGERKSQVGEEASGAGQRKKKRWRAGGVTSGRKAFLPPRGVHGLGLPPTIYLVTYLLYLPPCLSHSQDVQLANTLPTPAGFGHH